MKRKLVITFLGLALSTTLGQAQSYTINWFTLDGGGDSSSGGSYSLNGTIGQPDAGTPMSGGVFNVSGGFWPGVTGGSVGPIPGLSIRYGTPNIVILSWPNPSTGYVLQQTANMNAPGGGWVDVAQLPVVNGAKKEVTLLVTGRFCVFRLHRP
jgi:hypothetical protein